MGGYQTVVVGTDGSETSLRAVDRAAALARDADATLVIACAYMPDRSDRYTLHPDELGEAKDILGDEAYQIVGSAPADDTLRAASERAAKVGAAKVEVVSVAGRPGESLRRVAQDHNADLLVVGNRGLNTLAGRIVGSVPLEVVRSAPIDVLIVHTT